MIPKAYKLKHSDFSKLISSMGACIASDKITVDGLKVGYMYREEPDGELDSGWRFLSGTESQEYLDDVEHLMMYDVNTIANYDRSIISYLLSPIGPELLRNQETDTFQAITISKPFSSES